MKIRIKGCTAEELAEYSPYLSLGKVYEATIKGRGFITVGDHGHEVVDGMAFGVHLPQGAKWVEVTE